MPRRSLKSFIDDADETVFFVPVFLVSFSVLAYLSFRQASLTFTLNPNSSHVSYLAQTRKTTPVILILQSVFCPLP